MDVYQLQIYVEYLQKPSLIITLVYVFSKAKLRCYSQHNKLKLINVFY